MEKEIYILNLAFTDFSVQGVTQLNMYNPLLGDITAIENFINRNEKINYLKECKFITSSLIFNYFPTIPNTRNASIIVEKIVGEYTRKIKSSTSEKYFVLILHGHGVCGYPTEKYPDGRYRIKIGESENGTWEFFSINEIASLLSEVLNSCNVFLILNTCQADTGFIFNSQFGSFDNKCTCINYSEVVNQNLFQNTNDFFDLHVLGMSSKSTISNFYREETLGINALLSLYRLGLDLNISDAFDILNCICQKSKNDALVPNMVVVTNKGNNVDPLSTLTVPKGTIYTEEKIKVQNIKNMLL